MNITISIASKIGGESEKLILNNPQIQFYANSAINAYQWRDSRYPTTADVWENESADTRKELIEIFKKHIENAK